MFSVKLIFIFSFCLESVTGQACDTSSDTPQCSDGEICSDNKCEAVVSCSQRSGCSSGLSCVSDYCQPEICNSTGECVNGQFCGYKRFRDRACVYLELLDAEEGSNVTLNVEPSTERFIDVWDINWYREGQLHIAKIQILIKNNEETRGCCSLDQAGLNTTTGALTLINVTVEDEGFYYVELTSIITGIDQKYDYRLKLNVTPSATIQGVSDTPVEVGTKLTLTCTAVKVNTEFTEMYWVVGGKNESGTNTTEHGVINYILVHEVTKEDEENPISCVVVPRFSDVITVEKSLNPGYTPTGKPVILVLTKGQNKGENVSLTCEKPVEAGNPPCNVYEWIKQEGNSKNLPTTQNYTFILDELHAGTYTCRCSNEFGESLVSDAVETLNLGEIDSKDKAGLIAGCVIGVLVLVSLVVIGVIVCKKYNIKLNVSLNIQTKTRDPGANEAGGKDTHVYEMPIHGVKHTDPNNNNNQYEEPVNRPKSEMNQYDYINEDEMDKEVGYVNTAFTTYEDVKV